MDIATPDAVAAPRAYEALAGEILRAQPEDALHPLIERSNWQRLQLLAEQLRVPVQTVCFECRMAEGDSRADLAVLLLPGEGARNFPALQRWSAHDSSWARFTDFVRAWASSANLSYRVPFLCVAFDLPVLRGTLPVPCLSLCIDSDFFAKRLGFVPPTAVKRPDVITLAQSIYADLTGQPLPSKGLTRLDTLLAADDTLAPKHLSVMLGRDTAPMKLDVEIRTDRLFEFLERIGWPCERSRLEDGVAAYLPHCEHVQLNLPVWPEQAGPLELELFAGQADNTLAERDRLLELLCTRKLASLPKAEVLRTVWANSAHGDGLARSWYLKLRFEGATACDAKAYLGLMPRMLRPLNGRGQLGGARP